MFKTSRPAAAALLRTLAPLTKAARPIQLRLRRLPGVTAHTRPAPQEEDGHELSHRFTIPVQTQSEDERQSQDARETGVFFARQERWQDLIAAVEEADHLRAATGTGLPISELLAFGARSDVVNSVEHALHNCISADDQPLLTGVMALEGARLEMGGDPTMAAVVALTHLDVGWAWRSKAAARLATDISESRAQAHFKRAWTLMEPLQADAYHSPFLQSAFCTAMATQDAPAETLANAFARLIDLDQLNYRNMRAFGAALSPAKRGHPQILEREARRIAALTKPIWGAGGYTWTYFDALTSDDQACQSLDVDLFIEGLRDIVQNRPSQETVNLLIAFCAIGMDQPGVSAPHANAVRHRISDASTWLVRDHLQELHPFHWAHASAGFDNNISVASPHRFTARGKADAHMFLHHCFREELAQGHQIEFSPAGLDVRPN